MMRHFFYGSDWVLITILMQFKIVCLDRYKIGIHINFVSLQKLLLFSHRSYRLYSIMICVSSKHGNKTYPCNTCAESSHARLGLG